jgi:hypothetical protein
MLLKMALRLVSSLQDIAVCRYQRFAIALRRAVRNRLQSVRYQSQKQKSGIATGKSHLMSLTARGIEGIRQTWYGGTHVGVCQGEFVTIQEWVLSNPHQWVVDRLRPSDFDLFLKPEMVCELLELAVLLGGHVPHEPSMSDSRNRVGIPQRNYCPHATGHEPSEPSSPVDVSNPICPLLSQLLEQLRQSSQERPTECPYMRMVKQEHWGVNQSGKEPLRSGNLTDYRRMCYYQDCPEWPNANLVDEEPRLSRRKLKG